MKASVLRHQVGPLLLHTRQHARRCLLRWRNRHRVITVIFRYDDYSTHSASELERNIINRFASHQARLTFGVIPFRCSGDVHDPSPQPTIPLAHEKADILRGAHASGTIEVALHGYSHQTIWSDEMTEFEGVAYERQKQKIAEGKRFLETITGVSVTTFIPPWNRYDTNTLRALQDEGFETLSAGCHGDACDGLRFLPATCDLTHVRDAVEQARKSDQLEPVIVVLFHDYEFSDVNQTLGTLSCQDFVELVTWLKQQRDVRLTTICGARRSIRDLSGTRYLARQWSAPGVY